MLKQIIYFQKILHLKYSPLRKIYKIKIIGINNLNLDIKLQYNLKIIRKYYTLKKVILLVRVKLIISYFNLQILTIFVKVIYKINLAIKNKKIYQV